MTNFDDWKPKQEAFALESKRALQKYIEECKRVVDAMATEFATDGIYSGWDHHVRLGQVYDEYLKTCRQIRESQDLAYAEWKQAQL